MHQNHTITIVRRSGGWLETVFRRAAFELFGVVVPDAQPLPYQAGRNPDFKEVVLRCDDHRRLPAPCRRLQMPPNRSEKVSRRRYTNSVA